MWQPRPPDTRTEGPTRVTLFPAGTWCPSCRHLRGGDRGYEKKTYRTIEPPKRDLSPELALLLERGKATLRYPASVKLAAMVETYALAGDLDADFEMHAKSKRWAVTSIHAPQYATYQRPLEALREELLRRVPGAIAWASRATTGDLRLAIELTNVPDWRNRQWPGRVWTAYLGASSKDGDVGRIAEALGVRVPRRDYALWFYGTGTLEADGGTIKIRGETCLTHSQVGRIKGVDAAEVRLIENRDLASIHSNGLILAVDGHPKDAHLDLLRTAARNHISTRAWFDMDAEGVSMARTVSAIPGVRVEGFAAYPPDWGIPIHEDVEKLRNLRLEQATEGPFGVVLQHIRAHERFWEQERIFAEAEVRGTSLQEFENEFAFPASPLGSTTG